MKKLFRYLKRSERGSTAIIVAVTMSMLMTFTAFTFDFGITYYETSKAQNAADAAALASAKLLPVGSSDASAISNVKNTAVSYVNKNGDYDISSEDIVLGDLVSGRYTSVKVNINGQVDMTIAQIIGVNTIAFTRHAKAMIAPCTSAGEVAPLGVEQSILDAALASGNTQHVLLKYGGGDGDTGSFGAIDLDGVKGGGANDYLSWLLNGYEGTIEVGQGLLPVEKGNMAGPTETAISQRYYQCTHFESLGGCTLDHFDPDCPRLLKILVIEKVGTQYISVKGFAVFVIEGVSGDEVLGSYVESIEIGNADGNANWSAEYGLYSISLVE